MWAFVSLLCILTASFITIVGTGVQDPSILVKNGQAIHWHAWPQNPNLKDIIGALTNIVFAYGGNMAVFTFCSEASFFVFPKTRLTFQMKRPNDFKKSFLMNQGLGTLMYILVVCHVSSPST
jgi:amino acid permease